MNESHRSASVDPIGVSGLNADLALPKIWRKTLKCGSLLSTGCFSDSNVVGTFLRIVASLTSAPVSRSRYFINNHGASGLFALDGIHTTSPPICPARYWPGVL